ncbi:hypothetical protein C9I90_02905 [Photobacterium aphoticum]|uniref:Uncharacterized protein n=2 Tax=Photobacterium aphoticum TaxID=754436 RepID=A0A0J1GJL2_9GAMM|nr:hypothetical protein ABT58_15495 [Photobacterium aphoticum]PSU59442.1 hypothetical protein C9I90_02905 [Photobacterium aphoticum]
MEYDFKSHPLLQLTQATQPEAIIKQFQAMMLAGKAVESITVASTKQAIEQSYQHSVKLLEAMDKQFQTNTDKQQALLFPFDVMDQFTRQISEQWKMLAGLSVASVADLQADLEQHKKVVLELNATIESLETALQSRTAEVEAAEAEANKAVKAKQVAQRNGRKLKAELEASAEQVKALEAQISELEATCEQHKSDNVTLTELQDEQEKTITALQADLATVKNQQQQQQQQQQGA